MPYEFNPFTVNLDKVSAAEVSDDAYGAGWNGDTTHSPSKNAVYDKIETIGGSITALAYAWFIN